MRRFYALIYCIILNCWLTVNAQSQCTVTHYDEFSGMAQWWVTQIVQDRHGMMWFATWNGLNRYDGYQFECFKSQVGDEVDTPSDRIQDIMLSDDGNLWCLIDGEVFLFDINTCKYHKVDKEQHARLSKVFNDRHNKEMDNTPYYYKDRYGTQWRIGEDGTISWQEEATGSWRPYPLTQRMKSPVLYCTTDNQGNVWLRSGYGAYKLTFHQPPYTFFPQEKPTIVRYFYIDKEQRYWITNKEDATVRLYDRDHHLLGYLGKDGRLHSQYTSFVAPVYCILQDSKGVFWFGSKPGGLFRLHEQSDGSFRYEQFLHDEHDKESLGFDHVFYLEEDRYGRLWVSTFMGGLNCVEHPHEERLRFLHKDNGLRLPLKDWSLVRQTRIIDDHIMLAVTTSGLIVADISNTDPRKIVWKCHKRDIHRRNSLSNNATMFVAEDARHHIYICTESGGVNEILSDNLLADQLEFRHYNLSTGFPSDVALSAVAVDSSLLVVSNNQLIMLKGDEHEAFFLKDKLRFADASPTRLPDGRWILALQDGAFTVRPQDIRNSTFIPPIALTGLSVENQPIAHAINHLNTLTLSPDERNFTIWFSALDFADNGDISYSFLMESDKGGESWNDIGKTHSATFLHLQPGTYQLRIRSTNSDGVWVDNERTLTVIVKPTFWETRWAQLLYLLLIGGGIFGILYTRQYIRNINRKQRETHEAYLALLNSQGDSKAQQGTAPAPTESGPKLKPEDDAFMRRTMKFIEEHISDPDINIGDLAEATATSRSGLNRKMKSLLGVTPLDFIREARIRKACQLLSEGLAVNDTAYSCGFSDPKYFAKCFKAETGMTPKEYKVENSAN